MQIWEVGNTGSGPVHSDFTVASVENIQRENGKYCLFFKDQLIHLNSNKFESNKLIRRFLHRQKMGSLEQDGGSGLGADGFEDGS